MMNMAKVRNMKNTKGEIYILICVIMLVILSTFSVIFTYASVITHIKVQQTNTEIVLDSFVANNSIIIFNNIKQGKNATEGVNTGNFRTSLKEFCTFEEKDGKYYAYDTNGSEKFYLTIPEMGYIEDEQLELYVTYTMSIPIYFAGKTVTTANVPIKVTSELTKIN